MKNLIKIIATITALGMMTACGASGLVDNLAQLVDKGLQALRLETAARQIRTEELAEFRENLDSSLTDQQREDMVVAEATRLANLTGTEKAEFDARVRTRVTYLAEVAGLTVAEREANELQCQRETTGEGCDVVLVTFCDASPFNEFCFGAGGYFTDAEYDIVRAERCVEDRIINNCTSTIARVCPANPFDPLCVGDDRYNTVRAVRCAVDDTEKASPRCEATVKRVCDLDVEDSLCDLIPAYTSQRLTLDDTVAELVSRGCDNDNRRGDSRCAEIRVFVCERQPLNPACDDRSAYAAARRNACLTGDSRTSDPLCAPVVENVCEANSLDTLCVGIRAYESLQESACRGESATSNPDCVATLTRVCGGETEVGATGNPFNGVCSNSVFNDVRSGILSACVTAPEGRLCTAGLANICTNTPFDDRCRGVESALPLQIRACIGQEATGNCADASFFTDPVILGCLTNPFDVACTASGSAFKPYEADALDATCLLNGARTGCVNPTAVFPTLTSTLVQVLTDPLLPFDATTNPYTGGVLEDPTMPHHTSTNRYISGFITIDADDLDDNGNLIPPGVEGSNFQFVTSNTAIGVVTHVGLGLNLGRGAARPAKPAEGILPSEPIAGGPVTMRRGGAGSDNDDGVAYFSTIGPVGSDFAITYGGILPTTNLGAPLLPQPVGLGEDDIATTWSGHVSYRQNPNAQNREVDFWVNFTKGTIGFTALDPSTSMRNTNAPVNVAISATATNLRLQGLFGEAHGLALGELGGLVSYGFGVDSGVVGDEVPSRGTFTVHGLIGQEGAVGVFTNTVTRATNDFIGGFTASNPEHPNNQ